MLTRVLKGAAAGAAGTTALNVITYLDMTLRGRASSSAPEKTVEALSSGTGIPVPGDEDTRGNRLQGLGALMGLATGVCVGAAFGALDEATGGRLQGFPTGVRATVVTTGALVGANGPMTLLGISDPRAWSVTDWVSDLVPHVGYGLVTALTYSALVD